MTKLSALKQAVRWFKAHDEIAIVYRDYDMDDGRHYFFTTEIGFDRMLDNGQVETNWIEFVIE